MKALKYSAVVLSLLAAFGANAQSQANNDDDDETANVTQTTESEYINLSGQVLTNCYLWVDVRPAASAINVRALTTGLVVARIQETCNNPSGYTLSISSQNNGALKNGTNSVNCSIGYDGTTEILTTPKTKTRTSARFDDISNVFTDFMVNFGAAPTAVAGTYSDTITLTITSSS